MDIINLAKEVQECYGILYARGFKNPDLEKGKVSKNYCLRRIDALRDELLEMKKEINKKRK